jgi:hypothetical protein
MNPSKQWRIFMCVMFLLPFYCWCSGESTTIKSRVMCEEGWEFFGDSCYKPVTSWVSQWTARGECEKLNASLAIISSSLEDAFVRSLVQQMPPILVWLGLRRYWGTHYSCDVTCRRRYWQWGAARNEPWADGGFTNWLPGEPKLPTERENCAEIARFGWRGARCSDSGGYICEKGTIDINGIADISQELLRCTFDNFASNDIVCLQQDTTDNFDWWKGTGRTRSFGTGPRRGFNFSAGYIYIEASSRYNRNVARVYAHLNYKGMICVQFAYCMYGSHMGALRVYVSQNVTTAHGSHRYVWEKHGNQGQGWFVATVSVPVSNSSIGWEATRGVDYKADIAVDDIRVYAGSCTSVGELFSCSFGTTQGTLCELEFESPDNATWSLKQNMSVIKENGRWRYASPDYGFGGSGYFIYMDASFVRQHTAKILINNLNFGGTVCVLFGFTMYGIGKCGIRMYSEYILETMSNDPWEAKGSHGRGWFVAAVETYMLRDVRLVWEATRGAGFIGNIALDEIRVESGNCAAEVVSCDFGYYGATLCNLYQERADTHDWRLETDGTPSRYQTPRKTSAGIGYYLIFTTRVSSVYDYAKLTFNVPQEGVVCIRFAYGFQHCTGYYYFCELSVYSITSQGVYARHWSKSEAQENVWHSEALELRVAADTTIGWLAFMPNTPERLNAIALDEIHVHAASCARSPGVLSAWQDVPPDTRNSVKDVTVQELELTDAKPGTNAGPVVVGLLVGALAVTVTIVTIVIVYRGRKEEAESLNLTG